MRARTNYFVKKKLQLSLTFRFLLLAVLFSFFVGFVVYVTIWPVTSQVISEDVISDVQLKVFMRALYFFLPLIFVISSLSIIFLHRIAGPLYRIERSLDQVIEGEDIEYIRLRKGDELQDLAKKINAVVLLIKKLKEDSEK
jgi:signal transduction histidine kinase